MSGCGCPPANRGPDGSHSDAAKRCADAVNLHRLGLGDDATGRWVAVALADGRSDGALYDTKRDAVRHQRDEFLCAYVCIAPGGMTVCEAESFLRTNRLMYDAGFRMPDPDARHGGRDLIPRLTTKDVMSQLRALRNASRR